MARWLWLRSRLDVVNDPTRNGERSLQEAVCAENALSGTPVIAIDVGANVGRWSDDLVAFWDAAGGSPELLQVHAFEPAPGAQERLRSLAATRAPRMVVVPGALGAAEGRAQLSLVGATAGTNTLLPLGRPSQPRIEVDVTTLDAYCERRSIYDVTVLKIDAEGTDLEVLRGATGLFSRRSIRWVQFEYNYRWIAGRNFLRDVFELITPLGYKVGKLTDRGVEPYPHWHPELESFREGNYVLWHDRLPRGLNEVAWWVPEDQR